MVTCTSVTEFFYRFPCPGVWTGLTAALAVHFCPAQRIQPEDHSWLRVLHAAGCRVWLLALRTTRMRLAQSSCQTMCSSMPICLVREYCRTRMGHSITLACASSRWAAQASLGSRASDQTAQVCTLLNAPWAVCCVSNSPMLTVHPMHAAEGLKGPVQSVAVLPRSLLVFGGEAYKDCLHGIDEVSTSCSSALHNPCHGM